VTSNSNTERSPRARTGARKQLVLTSVRRAATQAVVAIDICSEDRNLKDIVASMHGQLAAWAQERVEVDQSRLNIWVLN
jgi:hypothetical protein